MINPTSTLHYCRRRLFFREMRHPGASNCPCPKYDDGSCVPEDVREEYFTKLFKGEEE